VDSTRLKSPQWFCIRARVSPRVFAHLPSRCPEIIGGRKLNFLRNNDGYKTVASESCDHRCDLRVQFAQLLTNRAGAKIDMSVLNRKSDYFDTFQVPCSDPGFFRKT
jgi:hypothetical protein